MQEVTGETVDISEYLDFSFYDHVWYKENAGLGVTLIGRWLGVSHRVGGLMSYWILTQKGTVISRTTVQRVTNLEKQTDEFKSLLMSLIQLSEFASRKTRNPDMRGRSRIPKIGLSSWNMIQISRRNSMKL